MRFDDTRFEVGEFCPAQRCRVLVVWCTTGRERILVDAEPSTKGTVLVRDTGGPDPLALILTTVQQFGRQGTLHVKHESNCLEAKKARRRK